MNDERSGKSNKLNLISHNIYLFLSTSKKDEDNSDKAYKNMDDDSTTAIDVTIPRIELGQGRAISITVFLWICSNWLTGQAEGIFTPPIRKD
jgi:hypothetical protein